MRWRRVGIGACSLLAPLVLQVEPAEAQWRGLTVGTWAPCDFGCDPLPSVALGNPQIDRMFSDANDVLWDDVDGEGGEDAFCGVGFARQDDVQTYFSGDGDVDNEAEFWDVNDHGSSWNRTNFVKVARTLTWCGRTGMFLGCTATGGKNSVMLAEWAVNDGEAGITFAHEFGHAVGLNDDDYARDNVMYAWGGTSPHGIWPWQCGFYSQEIDSDGPGVNPSGRSVMTARARFPQELHVPFDFTGIDIADVARRRFVDVVPSEVADYYGPHDVEVLTDMLEDPREARHHATIAQLIGLIDGGKSERPTRTLLALAKSRTSRHALAAATLSLGYLAHRGDHTAFSFLREHARDLRSPLTAWAIQALGLSGRDDAKGELEQLQREADADAVERPRPGRALRLLRQALDDNARIRRAGLRAYYGR